MKFIEKMRKQERQWRWARWIALLFGASCTILFFVWGLYLREMFAVDLKHPIDSGDLLVFALLWTKCCMYFIFAVLSFAMVWRNRRGNVKRMLFLKLLDAQRSKTESNGHTG